MKTPSRKSSSKKIRPIKGTLLKFTPGMPYKDNSGTTNNGSNTPVLPANPERVLVDFQNTSDTDMRLDFGSAATAATGYLIKAGLFWRSQAGICPTDSINVFCTAAKTFTLKTV